MENRVDISVLIRCEDKKKGINRSDKEMEHAIDSRIGTIKAINGMLKLRLKEQKILCSIIKKLKDTHDVAVTEKNFFDCTVANWIKRDVEFKADYKSESGSEYMYTNEGVYRKSDHWLDFTGTCVWNLEGSTSNENCIAFCEWRNFAKYSKKGECFQKNHQDNIVKMISAVSL